MKKLFPTISQPQSSTYIDILINVRKLKKKAKEKTSPRSQEPLEGSALVEEVKLAVQKAL